MSDAIARIRTMIADEVGHTNVRLEAGTSLDDIPGWDSIAFAGVVMAVEGECMATIPRDRIDAIATVGDFVAILQSEAVSAGSCGLRSSAPASP